MYSRILVVPASVIVSRFVLIRQASKLFLYIEYFGSCGKKEMQLFLSLILFPCIQTFQMVLSGFIFCIRILGILYVYTSLFGRKLHFCV